MVNRSFFVRMSALLLVGIFAVVCFSACDPGHYETTSAEADQSASSTAAVE